MDLTQLSDEELEIELKERVRIEREDTIPVLEALAECDRRCLAERRGFASLYDYCRQELRYAEGGAYRRIRAARCSRKWPEVLEELKSGSLNLEVVALLHPYHREVEFPELLHQAKGKGKREVELMLAERFPGRAPLSDYVRYLGSAAAPTISQAALVEAAPPLWGAADGGAGASPQAPSPGGELLSIGAPQPADAGARAGSTSAVTPLSLVRIAFTATRELWGKIERARDILRHKYPQGRLEQVLGEGMETFLDHKDPARRLLRKAPRARSARALSSSDESSEKRQEVVGDASRRIPAAVREEVRRRDEGSCVFVSLNGRRCGSSVLLEFDHVIPFGQGGASDDPANLRLLCRAHHQLRTGQEAARRVL